VLGMQSTDLDDHHQLHRVRAEILKTLVAGSVGYWNEIVISDDLKVLEDGDV
jgi:hypothetical protein